MHVLNYFLWLHPIALATFFGRKLIVVAAGGNDDFMFVKSENGRLLDPLMLDQKLGKQASRLKKLNVCAGGT